MARHIAFLRAINVGGHIVKMDALRRHCEGCGLSHVETFIASGNVIFDSRAAAESLEKKIESALHKALGYEVAAFIRSAGELSDIVAIAEAKRGDARNAYVGFMKALPPPADQKKAAALTAGGERVMFKGREVYWFTPAGFSDSKFSAAALERITRSPATFRNITTVTKLAQKYGDH